MRKHCVVVVCDTQDEAQDIAADLLMNELAYRKGDTEDLYHHMTTICEDISGVIMLVKRDEE